MKNLKKIRQQTRGVKIVEIGGLVTKLVEATTFTRFPRPYKLIHGKSGETANMKLVYLSVMSVTKQESNKNNIRNMRNEFYPKIVMSMIAASSNMQMR